MKDDAVASDNAAYILRSSGGIYLLGHAFVILACICWYYGISAVIQFLLSGGGLLAVIALLSVNIGMREARNQRLKAVGTAAFMTPCFVLALVFAFLGRAVHWVGQDEISWMPGWIARLLSWIPRWFAWLLSWFEWPLYLLAALSAIVALVTAFQLAVSTGDRD